MEKLYKSTGQLLLENKIEILQPSPKAVDYIE